MWWSEARRAWSLAAAALAVVTLLATLLGGCGFELRRTPPLPFARIALVGFDSRSPLAAELRAALQQQVQIAPSPVQADVVLHVLRDQREKSVVASTAAGQVREIQLRLKLEFRLSTAGGRELIPATELMLTRDMSYSETFALAKGQEEAELYAAMQTDVVQQTLRRLARANLARGADAGASPAGAAANPSATPSAPAASRAAPA